MKITLPFSAAIVQSFLGVAAITLLIRVVGYAEKLFLAYRFGTGALVDSYMVVFTFIMSVFVFFREIIEPGFLNTFLSAREQKMDQSAWNIFNSTGRIIILVSVAMTIMVELWPGHVIRFIAPGFSGNRLDIAVMMLRIGFPAAIFLNLSSLTNITLNSLKIFTLPAAGDFALKALVLISLIAFVPYLGIYSVLLALVLGSIVKVAIHASRIYKYINFGASPVDPVYRKQMIALTIPLLIGVAFSQFSSLAENMFASFLQEGMISAIAYARKVVELPVTLFPYLLSTILFPFFSQTILSGNVEEGRSLFSNSVKVIIIVFIPVSIFLAYYAEPVVAFIFQRGAFNAAATKLTMKPLFIYATGALFLAVETVLVVFFYAKGKTKEPILVGIICVIIDLSLTYLLIDSLNYLAIPLGYVTSKVVKVGILSTMLVNRGEISLLRTIRFVLNGSLAGVAFIAVIILFNQFVPIEGESLLRDAAKMFSSALIGMVIYIGLLVMLKVLPRRTQS